jgi:hypothetical protein
VTSGFFTLPGGADGRKEAMMRTLIGSQDETLCEIQRKVRAMLED